MSALRPRARDGASPSADTRLPLARHLCLSVALAISCGDSGSGSVTESATATTGATSTSTTDEGESESTGESTGATLEPLPARGIALTHVDANQGVAVQLTDVDGGWIGARTTALIRDRPMMIRAFVDVADDWQEREIEGRLLLRGEDGEASELVHVQSVSGDSSQTSAVNSFIWRLPANAVKPGLEFQVVLYEVDDAMVDTPAPDPAPVHPLSGLELVGVEDWPAEIKIVLVPVHNTFDGCDLTADLTDEVVEDVRSSVYQINPVQEVRVEIADAPIEIAEALTSAKQVREALVDRRFADGAAPNEYYVGLYTGCQVALSGCQSGGIPTEPTKELAYQRVIAQRYAPPFIGGSLRACMGLAQGRRHVLCTGDEVGVDPLYPYEGGAIGVWGWSPEDDLTHPPSDHFDYLSGCTPQWVSDYTWQGVTSVIKELTSWDYAP